MQSERWFGGENTERLQATVRGNSARGDAGETMLGRKRASFFHGFDGEGMPITSVAGHWRLTGVTDGTRRRVPSSFLAGSSASG